MDYVALKAHIDSDPDARDYVSLDDGEVATSLNTAIKVRNKASMSGSEVLQSVDTTEFNALSDTQENRLWGLLGLNSLDPFGQEAQAMIKLFGGGSDTITNLQAQRVENVTDGVFYGFGTVLEGHVTKARLLA